MCGTGGASGVAPCFTRHGLMSHTRTFDMPVQGGTADSKLPCRCADIAATGLQGLLPRQLLGPARYRRADKTSRAHATQGLRQIMHFYA